MLNRILSVAVAAGLLAGVAVTAVQLLWTTPLIAAAEVYENATTATPSQPQPPGHGVTAGHDHTASAAEPWAPAEGFERTLWTLVANVLIGVGGGLILAAAFSLRRRVGLVTGLAFGGAAFAAFGLAPALGLPPELPGTVAAELGARQAWWAGTAVATLAGIATAAYGRRPWLKAAGLLLLALPHLIGAPTPEVHGALAPAALQREFVAASLAASAVFWVLLGGATGLLAGRLSAAEPASGAA